jgi:hypothetical protein
MSTDHEKSETEKCIDVLAVSERCLKNFSVVLIRGKVHSNDC